MQCRSSHDERRRSSFFERVTTAAHGRLRHGILHCYCQYHWHRHFTSLGFQVAEIQSGFALLMLWIVGGIAALCGALCYGELSAALPRSGGEYHFLSRIYHPALGFMAGFVSATVGFAAPIALAAMAFGTYLHGVLDFGSPVLFSFAVVWVVTVFHLRNLQIGSVFQNLW